MPFIKKAEEFDWLDKAYEARSLNLIQLTDDPCMKRLKSDRRWKEFIEKIGFPRKSDIKIDF